jgi:hypothetical protein
MAINPAYNNHEYNLKKNYTHNNKNKQEHNNHRKVSNQAATFPAFFNHASQPFFSNTILNNSS